jgi:hypothetical protein
VATSIGPFPPSDGAHGIVLPSISADGRFVGFSVYSIAGDIAGPFAGVGGPTDAELYALNAFAVDRVTGATELVSRNSAGEPAQRDPVFNGNTQAAPFESGSFATSFSADGRYVTFTSDGANLGGPVGPGHVFNVYRRDRSTGETKLVSTDEGGAPLHTNSYACTGRNLSGDGRRLAFSDAAGTDDAGNEILEIRYVDIETGRSRVISRPPAGVTPKGSDCPVISRDGTHVGFVSDDDLVPDDTNGTTDVYEYDTRTSRLTRVSVTSAGEQVLAPARNGRGASVILPAVTLSADGRYSAFDFTGDLAPATAGATAGPPNHLRVYVHDLLTGRTILASVSSSGEELAGDNGAPYIAADGRSVAFMSTAFTAPPNGLPVLDAPWEDVVVRTPLP